MLSDSIYNINIVYSFTFLVKFSKLDFQLRQVNCVRETTMQINTCILCLTDFTD